MSPPNVFKITSEEDIVAIPKQLVLPEDNSTNDNTSGSIFFVGNATVILRYAGFTILTDPNFLHKGDHVHLGYGLRSTRTTNPAIELADLPPLDLILLSHLHEDHFDRVVERELNKVVPIITTQHGAAGLARKGFTAVQSLATWQTLVCTKGNNQLKVTAMPGRHGPPIVGRLLPPVMGSMLEFQNNHSTTFRMYISGDTLVYDALRDIPNRYPHVDLALLHLGGARVLGLLVTMDATHGVAMIKLINPSTAIPIHYNDYTVMKSSLADFEREVREAGLEQRVKYLHHGQTYHFEPQTLHGQEQPRG
jgi:L-ascorbate metabolism protein UlaG (beta-lactamase superfamily)